MKCPDCDGSGEIVGLFPVWCENVPVPERKPYVIVACSLCDGIGKVDEGFPKRKERGNQMRQTRIEHLVTLRDFSRRYGIDVVAVSNFERGKQCRWLVYRRLLEAYKDLGAMVIDDGEEKNVEGSK